jgi:hypothetical protein
MLPFRIGVIGVSMLAISYTFGYRQGHVVAQPLKQNPTAYDYVERNGSGGDRRPLWTTGP